MHEAQVHSPICRKTRGSGAYLWFQHLGAGVMGSRKKFRVGSKPTWDTNNDNWGGHWYLTLRKQFWKYGNKWLFELRVGRRFNNVWVEGIRRKMLFMIKELCSWRKTRCRETQWGGRSFVSWWKKSLLNSDCNFRFCCKHLGVALKRGKCCLYAIPTLTGEVQWAWAQWGLHWVTFWEVWACVNWRISSSCLWVQR